MSAFFSEPNLKRILNNITQHSPHPSKVKIVAVTKGFSSEAIFSALSHKINCIGENKVQEFLNKKREIKNHKIETHLIGHLQSNKIKKAVQLFNIIETIDSVGLAEKINKHMESINSTQRIYIQINIGEDPKKFGFALKNIFQKIEKIEKMKHLKIEGTMTILPNTKQTEATERYFAHMRTLSQNIKEKVSPTCSNISMGMSQDYVYALKQGATHLRIGTLLYGNR